MRSCQQVVCKPLSGRLVVYFYDRYAAILWFEVLIIVACHMNSVIIKFGILYHSSSTGKTGLVDRAFLHT